MNLSTPSTLPSVANPFFRVCANRAVLFICPYCRMAGFKFIGGLYHHVENDHKIRLSLVTHKEAPYICSRL